MTFDPANFVMLGVRPSPTPTLMESYIDYLHIKDGNMASVPSSRRGGRRPGARGAGRPEGTGFEGFASLEPHLARAGEFSGFSGEERFAKATQALKGLLTEIGA